ncbi:HAMP domain-containing protein [bacterium]|nr:HAMP domain-containing protein [bacterium]
MKLSLRRKTVIALLAISFASSTATGLLGIYRSHVVLTQAALDRMSALRVAKQGEVSRYLEHVADHVRLMSRTPATIQASEKFVKAFEALNDKAETPEESERIRKYYQDQFLLTLNEHGDTGTTIDSILPTSRAARYLQDRFIIRNPNSIYEKSKLLDMGDGSEYSKVHAEFHPNYLESALELDYYDLMIFHPETRELVYTIKKEIDLGSSYRNGPFASTKLAQAVNSIDSSTARDTVLFVDFEFYTPSYGHPAMFLVSPIRRGDRLTGIFALQFSPDRLNRIFAGGNPSETLGLGQTGESFLVGKDGFMRSDSRHLIENQQAYFDSLRKSGHDEKEIQRMRNFGSTILTVHRNPESIRQIFDLGTNTTIMANLLNAPVITSYAPIQIGGLDWAIVAQIDESEALEPERKFIIEAGVALAAILCLSGLAALVAGAALSRPVLRLTQAVRAFVNGFRDVRVSIDSGDEVAELAQAFNTMASEIGNNENRLKQQVEKNRRLLENFLPATVLARLRRNLDDDASTYRDATLAFVEVEGLDHLFEYFDTNKANDLLQALAASFDEVAARHGVEKLSSSGGGYLAACGLKDPIFDHTPRILAFSQELENLIAIFNAQNFTRLQLSIGIHRGPIHTGRIGRNEFVNNLWARTVSLATEIQPTLGRSAIRVSDEVKSRVMGHPEFQFESDTGVRNSEAWTLRPGHPS